MTIIIAALLLGLLRAATKVITNIDFYADNWYFSAIDLTFILISGYWFFTLFKGNKWFKLFYIGVLVSLPIFRFQEGFSIILVFLPFLAIFYKHKSTLEGKNIKDIFLSFLKIAIYPILLVAKIIERFIYELKSKKASALPSYSIYILAGVVVGGFILIVLYNLDPEFKKWLENIEPIINTIRYTFGVFAFYIGWFLWFYYGPIVVKFSVEEGYSNIDTVLKFASLVITAIVVGYVLYDTYILLRMIGILSLVFESIGKNTQMYFLEMVILGGIFTYVVSLLLDKINSDASVNSHKKVLRSLLIFALFFLLPPLINVLRAILLVYVPEFGLTVRRLFGVYVTISLLAAFIFIVYKSLTKQTKIFLNSILIFFVLLFSLSFYLPNSLLIFNWHFNKYIENTKTVDYKYMVNLNVGKWGFLFEEKLEPQLYIRDTLLLWKFESDKQHKVTSRKYRDLYFNHLNNEVEDLSNLLIQQDFKNLYSKYLYKNYNYLLVFEKVPGLTITKSNKETTNNYRDKFGPTYDNKIYYNDYFLHYNTYSKSVRMFNTQNIQRHLVLDINYVGNYSGFNGTNVRRDSINSNIIVKVDNDKRDGNLITLADIKPFWIQTRDKAVDQVTSSDIVYELCTGTTSLTSSYKNQCNYYLQGIIQNKKVPPLPQEAIDFYYLGPNLGSFKSPTKDPQDLQFRVQNALDEEKEQYLRYNNTEVENTLEQSPSSVIEEPTPQANTD